MSDGVDPNRKTVTVVLGDAPAVDVLPRSERPEAQFLVTASATGGSDRVWVEGRTSGPRGQAPDGYEPAEGAVASADGRATRIEPVDGGPAMVLVPGGPFRFGDRTAGGEATVTVSPFYIDRTEVTVGEWRRYRQDAGSRTPQPSNADAPPQTPAVGLKLRDVLAYAEWAGKSLPSEVQWEKAARGSASLPNVWGSGRPLWSRPRTPGVLHDAGAYPNDRSVTGALDLAGNAREWTLDPWEDDPYPEADGSTDWSGPKRPRSPSTRVLKGEATGFSVIARDAVDASATDPLIGFRCVLPVD